jgi:hypothetical protein
MGRIAALHTAARCLLRRVAVIRGQDGVGLVGVLVAMAIAGGAVVMFLSSLSTGTKTVGVMYQRSMAENLARSQLEYVKSLGYVAAPALYDNITALPPGFTVSAEAAGIAGRDDNVQKITVTVYRDGRPVLFEEGFKVNR